MSTQENGYVADRRTGSFTDKEFYNFAYKIMLLGDSSTGKTCLLIRFKDGTFLNNNFISTVGIDYRIWDTAGQERFRSVTHAYYRDASGLLLIFDVTNKLSFENVRNWLSDVKEYANENVKILLVGNKVDLNVQRKVKTADAQALADTYKIPYMETSARTGYNVIEAFMRLASELTLEKVGKTGSEGISVIDSVSKKSWCSCSS